jgi:hypothetical protein
MSSGMQQQLLLQGATSCMGVVHCNQLAAPKAALLAQTAADAS